MMVKNQNKNATKSMNPEMTDRFSIYSQMHLISVKSGPKNISQPQIYSWIDLLCTGWYMVNKYFKSML